MSKPLAPSELFEQVSDPASLVALSLQPILAKHFAETQVEMERLRDCLAAAEKEIAKARVVLGDYYLEATGTEPAWSPKFSYEDACLAIRTKVLRKSKEEVAALIRPSPEAQTETIPVAAEFTSHIGQDAATLASEQPVDSSKRSAPIIWPSLDEIGDIITLNEPLILIASAPSKKRMFELEEFDYCN